MALLPCLANIKVLVKECALPSPQSKAIADYLYNSQELKEAADLEFYIDNLKKVLEMLPIVIEDLENQLYDELGNIKALEAAVMTARSR